MDTKQMLEGLKSKGFTAKAVEAELGFSNGSLGKSLSATRMEKLLAFYELHCGDTEVEFLVLRGGLKIRATDDAVRRYFGPVIKSEIARVLPAESFDVVAAAERVILNVAESEKKLASPKVVDADGSRTNLPVPRPSMDDLKKLLITPTSGKGYFDTEEQKPAPVNYGKKYLDCMFEEERVALLEEILADPYLSAKEKANWKREIERR